MVYNSLILLWQYLFIAIFNFKDELGFEKREILLILGVLFLMIGMMAILAPIYAVIIAILVYFGIRVFVGRRKKQLLQSLGQGVCAICGAKIINNKCPNCDAISDENNKS